MPDKKGETPIHRAARIGSVQALEILCEFDKTMGFSLIKLRSKMNNRTVLHHATENASIAPVKFLLEQDKDQINVPDGWDRLPIHLASTLGKKDMVTLFMSKGTKTMEKDKGERLPIHYAAEKGSLEIVRLLIRENPNCLNIPDNQKKTPLMLAAKCGFPDVVKYLLNKPVNFEATDIYRRTAFDWAIAEGNVKVIEVFVHNENWKQIIHSSVDGAEGCFAKLVESMPETAVTVMQRCITENKEDKVREYDFFCFDSKGEDQSLPSFRAILSIVESSCEDCLTHPLCLKYINRKWRKRGFGFNLLDILATLIFHICLIMYTSKIHEMLDNHRKKSGGQNASLLAETYVSERDNPWMPPLRLIMLIYVFLLLIRNTTGLFFQRFKHFATYSNYLKWALCISVLSLLLPVHGSSHISPAQLSSGTVALLISWMLMINFLCVVPVVGVYIVAIEQVLWTLIKMFLVIIIFITGFASIFHMLLSEHEGFRNFPISVASTFAALTFGLDYTNYFVRQGSYPQLYNFKFVIFVLFVLVMTIAVSNTLIGLAIRDTAAVMKSARVDKLRHKAKFVIRLEEYINRVPGCRIKDPPIFTEDTEKNSYHLVLDFIYEGAGLDSVDAKKGGKKEPRADGEAQASTSRGQQNEIKVMFEVMNDMRKADIARLGSIETKLEEILEKVHQE